MSCLTSGTESRPPEVAPSVLPTVPAFTNLQSQFYDTQTSLTNYINKVHALKGIIAKPDTIKWEVGLLRQPIEKITSNNVCNCEEGEFGVDDDDARSIRTIILHELEVHVSRKYTNLASSINHKILL